MLVVAVVVGVSVDEADLTTFAKANKLGTLYSPTFYVAKAGATDAATADAAVPAYVEYTLTSANKGTFGSNGQLFYSAKVVYNAESPAKVSSANNGAQPIA